MKDDFAAIGTVLKNLLNIVGGVLIGAIRLILLPITLISHGINLCASFLATIAGNTEPEQLPLAAWLKQVSEDALAGMGRGDTAFQAAFGGNG